MQDFLDWGGGGVCGALPPCSTHTLACVQARGGLGACPLPRMKPCLTTEVVDIHDQYLHFSVSKSLALQFDSVTEQGYVQCIGSSIVLSLFKASVCMHRI